jgi:hypothetical protein
MSDCIVEKLLKRGERLTQENYLRLGDWDNRKLEDLGPEERCSLPEDFELWPRTEKDINSEKHELPPQIGHHQQRNPGSRTSPQALFSNW